MAKPRKRYAAKLWAAGYRRCAYCPRVLRRNEMTADHIKPRSLGGYDKWRNIAPACAKCNSEKGNTTVEEFRKLKEKTREH